MENWAQNWQLRININKSSVLHSGYHYAVRPAYTLFGSDLVSPDSMKDLGIFITGDLMFSHHINVIGLGLSGRRTPAVPGADRRRVRQHGSWLVRQRAAQNVGEHGNRLRREAASGRSPRQ